MVKREGFFCDQKERGAEELRRTARMYGAERRLFLRSDREREGFFVTRKLRDFFSCDQKQMYAPRPCTCVFKRMYESMFGRPYIAVKREREPKPSVHYATLRALEHGRIVYHHPVFFISWRFQNFIYYDCKCIGEF